MNRIGALLGNWNDRAFARDTRRESPWIWHVLDRIAGRLYTWGERD